MDDKKSPCVNIGSRPIGLGYKTWVVAEMSANHCNHFPTAARTIVEAKNSGAHAIKVQAYTPDTMTLKSDDPIFQAGGRWKGRSLYDLYSEAALPWDWIPRLKSIADGAGIEFFSTVYDISSVEFLEERVKPSVYKIASFELTDMPLLRRVAQTAKPVILSTGMASAAEIDAAVRTLHQHGAGGVILLQCVSAYPADPTQMSLATMVNMMHRFNVPVGLSDHTMGVSAAIAAATLQACMIEKHFKLDGASSPDSEFSMSPVAFGAMAKAVAIAQASVGMVRYEFPAEDEMRAFRRSIFVVRPMKAGQRFTGDDIRVVRPAVGVSPTEYDIVLQSIATMDIAVNAPLMQCMFGPPAPVRPDTAKTQAEVKRSGATKKKVKARTGVRKVRPK